VIRTSPRTPVLRTRRLILRAPRPDDADAIAAIGRDPRVSRWLLAFPYPYPEGAAAGWIGRARRSWHDGTAATFVITLAGAVIGAIGVHVSARHDHAELGYWLGVPYWGQGYATEAGRAVVPWAFRRWDLQRIYAEYLGENHASGRVLEKIGMLREGVRRRHFRKGRRWYDAHQFGILREEVGRRSR